MSALQTQQGEITFALKLHEAAEQHAAMATGFAVLLGMHLLAKRELLAGGYRAWVETECRFSKTQAHRYTDAARVAWPMLVGHFGGVCPLRGCALGEAPDLDPEALSDVDRERLMREVLLVVGGASIARLVKQASEQRNPPKPPRAPRIAGPRPPAPLLRSLDAISTMLPRFMATSVDVRRTFLSTLPADDLRAALARIEQATNPPTL